jgi:hypothetical protein
MLSVRARRLVALLAALTALVLAGCAGATTLPAFHAVGAQDRVGAFNVVASTLTGPGALRSACVRPGSGVSGPETVAGFCVAAEGGGAAVEAAVHGNSAASTATSYLYRLTNGESGDLLKWGISKNPGSRYTQGFLQDKSMELMTSGTRREMLDLERFIVERDPGPLNREPWAGSQPNDVPGGP